jgi:hypothetical protein
MCTRCGYNLIGQRIVREKHYAMLIVRCPECATVASVQEYPLLGGWARRWGVVLAALWFILLLATFPASSGAIFGFSLVIAEEAARGYAAHLTELHAASEAQATVPSQPSSTRIVNIPGGVIQLSRTSGDFEKGWRQQDHRALLAAAGGWRGAVEGEALLILVPVSVFVFVVGWLWSVFLIQLKRRWLVVCAAAILVLTCLFALFPVLEWRTLGPSWSRMAALGQLGLPTLAVSVAFCIIPLGLGLWLGRPLTRFCVRGLLPPRLWHALVLLWTAEGLAPPAPRAR